MESKLCRYLDWDSEFFGLRIARLEDGCLTSRQAAEVERWCETNQIDCLYFLANSEDAQTAATAQAAAFLHVDDRLTLARSLPAESVATPAVRAFRAEDESRLRSIARASFHDSRFYHDPHFSRASCDALYETWIERSFKGAADALLVALADGEAAGFISCDLQDAGTGSISLVAVASGAQGRGLGKQLIAGALRYFAAHGRQQVTVVTQGRNELSRNLYRSSGFQVTQMQRWYHRWFPRQTSP